MANIIAAHSGDINNAAMQILIANRSFSKAGLADHATAHEDVLTANALTFCVDGVMYTRAALAQIDISAQPVVDETGQTKPIVKQHAGTTRVYLLVVDSAGAVSVVQRAGVMAEDSNHHVPGCPRGYAPFGAVKVENASVADFIFGTTSKTAAGITASYFDLSLAPMELHDSEIEPDEF